MPERPRYEPADFDARATAWTGLLLALGIVVCATIAWIVQRAIDARSLGPDRAPAPVLAEPALESDAVGDRQAFEQEKNTRLTSYGWVDRGKGRVHVPIDQAMRELAEQKR
jgi:hypothetical protein